VSAVRNTELKNTATIVHTTAMTTTDIISYKAPEATRSNLGWLNLGDIHSRTSYEHAVCFTHWFTSPTKHPVWNPNHTHTMGWEGTG